MLTLPGSAARRRPLVDHLIRCLGAALLVALPACGALNPTLVGTAGVNATSTVELLPGNTVVVFINQTAFTARVDFATTEEENITNLNRLSTGAASFIASAYACDLSNILVTEAAVVLAGTGFSIVTDATDQVNLLGGVNFGCGSVVVITLSGTAENFNLVTQVF